MQPHGLHHAWLPCPSLSLEVDSAQLRGSSKPILLQLHAKLTKNSTPTILQLFGIWSKLEKAQLVGVWLQKKKSSFWSVVFYYSAQQQWTFLFLKKKFISFVCLALPGLSCRTWDLWCGLWVLAPWPGLEPRPPAMRARGLSRWAAREVPNEPFLDWTVMCNKRWILYYSWWWPAQWLDWEEAPKHFPKPNLHQKRSWSLMPWSTTAFWIPANVCSANWGDWPKTAMPAGGIGQQNGPSSSPWQCSTTCRTTNASKVE